MAVYGNRAYENTLVQMEDVAERCGFQVIDAFSAVAEHSTMCQYAVGCPDNADCNQLADFAGQITKKIKSNDLKKACYSNRPNKKAGGAGLVPKARAICTECGFCAKLCPTKVIDYNLQKTTD